MAIYHLSAQVISRSSGRSAVAAAAYRAGEELTDERTGEVHNYKRKQVAEHTILAPQEAPAWVYDRQRLWNEVETAEKRKDAQLCREINVALPVELSNEQQAELLHTYVRDQFVSRGMVADVAIHRNTRENPHGHIMLTTREITSEGFGPKNREWNQRELLEAWREQWAVYANRELERAGLGERIDHRSFQDQGIEDRMPTIHEGPNVREMEKRGIRTDRGDINRSVKEHNAIVVDLEKYRKEREELRGQNRTSQPKELQRAAAIIGSEVTRVEQVQQGYAALIQKEDGLNQQEQRIKDEYKPFDQATRIYQSIDRCEQEIRELGSMFKGENRRRKVQLQGRIESYQKDLRTLGFHERSTFEARKTKVEEYGQKELSSIRTAREEIDKAKTILREAEALLKAKELHRVKTQYADWPAARHFTYEDAKNINALNEKAGRILSRSEIVSMYKDANSRMNGIQQKINDINKTADRLRGAGQWVEKYEKYDAEVQRMESGLTKLWKGLNKEAGAQHAANVERRSEAERMMNHFGVADPADFRRQLQQHELSRSEKPGLEQQAASLKPVMNLVEGAFRALESAQHAENREQTKQEWIRKKAKQRVNVRQQDQEYER